MVYLGPLSPVPCHSDNVSEPQLDPRWEWIESPTYGGPSEYIRGACRHLNPVEVRTTVTDEVVAHLCPDCDIQLPAEWRATTRR